MGAEVTESVHEDHQRQEALSVVEQGGLSVVRLASTALADDQWPSVRVKLRRLLCESPQGLVLDCRQLPSGASSLVAPLLYELLLSGRQRHPRIEVSAVGNEKQTVGSGSAFLLPPRFETIEAAAASVQRRLGPQGALPVKFARGSLSQEAIFVENHRHSFFQTGPGQVLLIVLVVGFTAGLIAYSASLSFAKVRPPRRLGARDADDRAVLQGNVRFLEGKMLNPDAGATLLFWPQGRQGAKLSLTAAELLDAAQPPRLESLVVVPVNSVGAYRLEAEQLALPASLYNILAISKHLKRDDPPHTDDLQTLAEQFHAPEKLLEDRQYMIRAVFLDANVTKDMDFILSASSSPATTAEPDESSHEKGGTAESGAPPAPVNPSSTHESERERKPESQPRAFREDSVSGQSANSRFGRTSAWLNSSAWDHAPPSGPPASPPRHQQARQIQPAKKRYR